MIRSLLIDKTGLLSTGDRIAICNQFQLLSKTASMEDYQMKHRREKTVMSIVLTLLLLSLQCSHADDQSSVPDPEYWPTEGWIESTPEEEGLNQAVLDQLEEYLETGNIDDQVDSILIVKNGYLAYESYPSGIYHENRTHHLFSVTKCFISALVGIAVEEGYIDSIHDTVVSYFPNYTIQNLDQRKLDMTIEHLLTMTSGMQWTDQVNYYQMAAQVNWAQYVLDRPMEAVPGTVWNYNSGGSHLLSALLESVTPNGAHAYAVEKLLDPLGIENFLWSRGSQNIPNGATLLYVTSRDLAKLGFLYLHDGEWNGTQIVPSEWVEVSTSRHATVEFDQGYGTGYGYKWWLYSNGIYGGRGTDEQYVVVIPHLDMVVASTGAGGYSFASLLAEYLLPAAGSSLSNNQWLIPAIGVAAIAVAVVLVAIVYKRRARL